MRRLATLALVSLGLPTIARAEAEEVVFRGRDIELARAFQCGGKQRAGRYALEAVYVQEPEPHGLLRVSLNDKVLCEAKSFHKPDFDQMKASKVRVITRVDSSAKAIEINVIVPSDTRGSIPNQTFHLPLAGGE